MTEKNIKEVEAPSATKKSTQAQESRRELDTTSPGILTCIKRSGVDRSKQRELRRERGRIEMTGAGGSFQMAVFDRQVS